MSVAIKAARFNDGRMWLELSDDRTLGVPLKLFPRLRGASPDQLSQYELSPRGIHWDALDEDLSLQGLLSTQPLADLPIRP